jgi:8-oxo-dGTP diphosphatase
MELKDLSAEMAHFVEAMGWNDHDTPKPQTGRDLAVSLSVEAAEVLELFQWTENLPEKHALASELADVCLYLLQLAGIAGINLEQAVLEKLKRNYSRSWG